MIKICFVHEEYPEETNFGGIATYQKNAAEELAKQGNKVYVICRGIEKNQQYIENGVFIYRIYVPKSSNQVRDYIIYRNEVAKLLKKLQDKKLIEIIETPDWGAETIFFEKYRKIPLVVRLHTPLKVWLKYNKNNFGKVTNKLLKWEYKMLLSADCITCCSQILKKIIVKEFPLNESDIIVTPNPANVIDFYRDYKIKKENKILYVGSLEERKGLCVLAKSLNEVFEKYPNLKIQFIGKDTNRNSYNISTIELIKRLVNEKYHKNLLFVGQISNSELNKYFNSSRVAIFPSLFDNFPYVVLEAMSVGLHIVGSENSGMVEMLNDSSSIYETGNSDSLSKKIIEKYEISFKEETNNQNIKKVKQEYNAKKICYELSNIYEEVIKKNISKTITKEELNCVLNKFTNEDIISFSREKQGVANKVFRVKTKENQYIIKKYFYNYDFELIEELYRIYEKRKINFIKPLNKKIINYNHFNYNIFEYKKREPNNYKNNIIFFKNIICCDKSELKEKDIKNKNSLIYAKCQKYYLYLKSISCNDLKLPIDDVLNVLELYNKIKNEKIIKEKTINHGDISYQNIIKSNDKLYLIDFDEVCIAPRLYDFAVVVIKTLVKQNKIDKYKYNKLKELLKRETEFKKYSDSDYECSLKYYLCKILLEKYYYHQNGTINLFSKRQKKDFYKKYYNLLLELDNL